MNTGRYNSLIFSLIVIVLLGACTNTNTSTSDKHIFTKLSSSDTGISFSNDLTENDSLNYFTYAYIYMGGGVSTGDINNDGLADLFFTGNMVPNRLYLNKGNLKFEDITEKAGISGDNRWYTGTTMADINNDGLLDIYCSVGGKFGTRKNQLFINNGDLTFSEKAEAYGLADEGNSVQATLLDYDKDGDLDMYVANYPPTPFNAPNQFYRMKQLNPKPNETDKLFRNDGDHFVDVTEEAGLTSFGLSLSATVGDINNDGWPDIYVSNDFSSPDYLFMNNRDGTFSEQVKRLTRNTSFYGMGADIADFNNDGLLDIFQVDMTADINRRAKANMASMNPELFWSTVYSGFHYQYMQNSLQMNNGNLNDSLPDFSNISRLAGVSSTDWSWGPLFSDLDNDGWKDLFISNGTRREINNRDYFLDWEAKGRPTDSLLQRSLAIPSEKIDNFVFKNNGDLTFQRMNKDWGIVHEGFTNGCVYVDLDNDGDLEIVTNNIDDQANIFENKSANINNYVGLNFKGPERNRFGVGVKTTVYTQGHAQYQEMTLSRGFQSSVAPKLHFGLGNLSKIDSIKVIWPDQKTQTLTDPKINSQLTLDYKDAGESQTVIDRSYAVKLFQSAINGEEMVTHRHAENNYDDFAKEILLPHRTSMFGPSIAVGDLNGDGKDDFVLSGPAEQETAIFYQEGKGFSKKQFPGVTGDWRHEDMGVHLFDVENDGDLDLYVASGGNEFSPNSPMLQDRLYINDGSGNLSKSLNALPDIIASGSRVKSFDFDKDGDLDLFVGGRLVPANYPMPADSYLLENVSTPTEPKFVDITTKVAPELRSIGMVTDALWTDYDNDGWTDLLIIGEWMPLTLFKNNNGQFINVTEDLGLSDTTGWWFGIAQGDFDKDGDMDYIGGNLGLNYKYKANNEETFDIYFDDFDDTGTKDIVLSYYNEGKEFPLRGRECSSQQMPAIKKKFKDYASFSEATLEDVYTEEELKKSLHYQVKSFASIYIENDNGKFAIKKLPNLAQISVINQVIVDDFDGDNNLDALIAGNLHHSEVETPRNDAGSGLLLKGDGQGSFLPIKPLESGLHLKGDVKDLARITVNGSEYLIAGKNNEFLQFVRIESPDVKSSEVALGPAQ